MTFIVFLTLVLSSTNSNSHFAVSEQLVFEDDFETDKAWSMFEEIVGGSSCYGDGIGEVVRSKDVAFDGMYSLRVWSNKALSEKSNHVIGQKKIANVGQAGIWRYEVHAYIAPETEDSGQTGPEFSIQNTRKTGVNEFRTSTAGIQYQPKSGLPAAGSWVVWHEVGEGVAGWQEFATQKLDAGKWYTMTVTANYDTNRYVQFTLQGDGIDLLADLSEYDIAEEAKFNEEAFWITLESENLWNNCGTTGNFDYKLYYDSIKLYQYFEIFLPVLMKN